MYRIVICDDEIFFCNHIEKLLRKYTESLADDMDIQIYTSSDAFLEDIGKSADLYFLDIKMPGNSGLELANVIRSISPDSVIIFVSSLQDAVYESIQYSPFRFIRKEYLETELKEAMDAFFAIRKPTASILELHTSTGDIFIPAITIHYVETASHYLNFYTTRQPQCDHDQPPLPKPFQRRIFTIPKESLSCHYFMMLLRSLPACYPISTACMCWVFSFQNLPLTGFGL